MQITVYEDLDAHQTLSSCLFTFRVNAFSVEPYMVERPRMDLVHRDQGRIARRSKLGRWSPGGSLFSSLSRRKSVDILLKPDLDAACVLVRTMTVTWDQATGTRIRRSARSLVGE